MKEEIKVGFCIAYDWYLLKYSLPLVYDSASSICLSIDKDRRSWANLSYEFDEKAFSSLVKALDVDGKISILEDDFHLPELTPMQNEVRQRNLMARHLGQGGWHVQLDCDEYFVDFEGFIKYLRGIPAGKAKKANVVCPLVNIFKEVEEGFLMISSEEFRDIEYVTVATRDPHYEYGRKNAYFNLYTKFAVLHQSWARKDQEVLQKLKNWGHKGDFTAQEFFGFWKGLSLSNFERVKNFHPISPPVWKSLAFIPATDVPDLISRAKSEISIPVSDLYLAYRNNKNISRLKSLYHKITGSK